MELQGQRALVTGATSGIGRAVAVKLADASATVLTTGRRAGFGDTHHVVADLGNLDDVRRLADEVGEIDALVNNAGIFPFGPTLDQDVETYEQVFDVNVRGPYFLTAGCCRR